MAQAKVQSSVSMTAEVFNTKGESVGKLDLPTELFGVEKNDALIAQAVRVHLANVRQGTRSTKTRTQVTGSTRKIYKQKGTGRARHGAKKAPIFVGGGIAHGPHPQDFSLDMPKTMRRKALFCALSDKFSQGQIKIVDGLTTIDTKTKDMMTAMKQLEMIDAKAKKAKKTMVVIPEYAKAVYLSGRNIQSLCVTEARLLNTYEVMTHSQIVIERDAIDMMKKVFLGEVVVKAKVEKKEAKKTEEKKTVAKKTVKKVAKK